MSEDSLKEQVQKTLIEFLRVDSDLAFTFLQTATIEADHDPQHSELAVERARIALATIRRLVVQIEDPAVRAMTNSRADELETAIGTFSS